MSLMGLFSKNSLRSLLSAAFVLGAGTPAVAKSAEKSKQTMSQQDQQARSYLVTKYTPLCIQLEENLPYCYKDNNVVTTGAGVHLRDYPAIGELEGVVLTLKKGTVLQLKGDRVRQMANANWDLPETKRSFPEVVSSKKIKLKDCATATGCENSFPKGQDRTWNQEQLIVLASSVLDQVNKTAITFCVQKAFEIHPNLFQLPPSAQLVVVDLVYNLGYEKYKEKFPKFQAAVSKGDLLGMQKECESQKKIEDTTKRRRDPVRIGLMQIALLSKVNPKLPQDFVGKQIRALVTKTNPKLAPELEKKLWTVLDEVVKTNFEWSKKRVAEQRTSVLPKGSLENN